jgi:hypothetical protein
MKVKNVTIYELEILLTEWTIYANKPSLLNIHETLNQQDVFFIFSLTITNITLTFGWRVEKAFIFAFPHLSPSQKQEGLMLKPDSNSFLNLFGFNINWIKLNQHLQNHNNQTKPRLFYSNIVKVTSFQIIRFHRT